MADKPDNRSIPQKVLEDIWDVTKKVGGDGVWINTSISPPTTRTMTNDYLWPQKFVR